MSVPDDPAAALGEDLLVTTPMKPSSVIIFAADSVVRLSDSEVTISLVITDVATSSVTITFAGAVGVTSPDPNSPGEILDVGSSGIVSVNSLTIEG